MLRTVLLVVLALHAVRTGSIQNAQNKVYEMRHFCNSSNSFCNSMRKNSLLNTSVLSICAGNGILNSHSIPSKNLLRELMCLQKWRWRAETDITDYPAFATRFIGRKLMATESLDETSEADPTKEEPPLLTFRVIGCSVASIFVGFTIIVYVTSGMFYNDCLAQICAEVCILASYTFILLSTTERYRIGDNLCLVISIFLHFLFVAAFLFSLIEVMCMCQELLSFFPKTIFNSTRSVLLYGWITPTIISGISAIVWYEQYTSKLNCWITPGTSPFYPTVIPIGICAGTQAVLLLIIFFISEVPLSVSQQKYKRAKCFLTTRWASAIIGVMLTASWACGVMAYHSREEAHYATFTIASIFLGICMFILRISTDEEMRKIVILNVLCFLIPPNNKVSAYSDKLLRAKRISSTETLLSHKNFNMFEKNERKNVKKFKHIVTSHR